MVLKEGEDNVVAVNINIEHEQNASFINIKYEQDARTETTLDQKELSQLVLDFTNIPFIRSDRNMSLCLKKNQQGNDTERIEMVINTEGFKIENTFKTEIPIIVILPSHHLFGYLNNLLCFGIDMSVVHLNTPKLIIKVTETITVSKKKAVNQ